jgi:hypothetical protein
VSASFFLWFFDFYETTFGFFISLISIAATRITDDALSLCSTVWNRLFADFNTKNH